MYAVPYFFTRLGPGIRPCAVVPGRRLLIRRASDSNANAKTICYTDGNPQADSDTKTNRLSYPKAHSYAKADSYADARIRMQARVGSCHRISRWLSSQLQWSKLSGCVLDQGR